MTAPATTQKVTVKKLRELVKTLWIIFCVVYIFKDFFFSNIIHGSEMLWFIPIVCVCVCLCLNKTETVVAAIRRRKLRV